MSTNLFSNFKDAAEALKNGANFARVNLLEDELVQKKLDFIVDFILDSSFLIAKHERLNLISNEAKAAGLAFKMFMQINEARLYNYECLVSFIANRSTEINEYFDFNEMYILKDDGKPISGIINQRFNKCLLNQSRNCYSIFITLGDRYRTGIVVPCKQKISKLNTFSKSIIKSLNEEEEKIFEAIRYQDFAKDKACLKKKYPPAWKILASKFNSMITEDEIVVNNPYEAVIIKLAGEEGSNNNPVFHRKLETCPKRLLWIIKDCNLR